MGGIRVGFDTSAAVNKFVPIREKSEIGSDNETDRGGADEGALSYTYYLAEENQRCYNSQSNHGAIYAYFYAAEIPPESFAEGQAQALC